MGLLWKRFFLMIVGAYLVLGSVLPGPQQPTSVDDPAANLFAKVILVAIGVLMIVRGSKLKLPPPKNDSRPVSEGKPGNVSRDT